MRERSRFFMVLVGCAACAIAFFATSGTAMAVDIPTTNTNLGSCTTTCPFSSPRNDFPVRPGTIVRSRYGPFNVPANSQVHNALGMVQPPCTNCYITDMVPSLVYQGDPNHSNGEVANLNNKVMMHHFVLSHPGRTDPVCPGGLQTNIPPPFGPGSVERFFASGNERTNAILPSPYGYFSTAPSQNGSTGGWLLIYHLVNKDTVAKNIAIEVTYRYTTTGTPNDRARPLWLDIDGCGDSEYSAPVGYSDVHADWTSTMDGRIVAISGHLHDVDITNANPCDVHCAGLGDGISVSAEVVSTPAHPSTAFFGAPFTGSDPQPHIPGATLCRSKGYYGTSWAANLGNQYNGHLDTMSTCGTYTDKPAGAQTEAYPAGGQYPGTGYWIYKGETIRVHSEYQNNNTQAQNDVMGIMVGWLAPPPYYVRPKGATPILSALVPAYQACTSANRAHQGSINNPSCNPGNQASGQATVGTPDSNGAVANNAGSVRMDVCPVTGCVAGNVKIGVSLADVRQKSTPANDYAGELQLKPTLRITDRNNGVSEGATVVDTPFGVTVPCATTPADSTIGSTCSVSTTANSVVPNALAANNRAIWEMGQIQVFDGGADGVAATSPNTLFAVQGVFIP